MLKKVLHYILWIVEHSKCSALHSMDKISQICSNLDEIVLTESVRAVTNECIICSKMDTVLPCTT